MKRIKVEINNEIKDAFLVDKVYKNKKKRTVKEKVYEWNEYYIHLYIPANLRNKKFIVIPI